MCSHKRNSSFSQNVMNNFCTFTWGKVLDELEQTAPLILSLLDGCAHTKSPGTTKMQLWECAALKLHHPKMTLIQRIVSIILYAGHAGKQVGFYKISYFMVLCRFSNDYRNSMCACHIKSYQLSCTHLVKITTHNS